MMPNPWDTIANQRYYQIASRSDFTFWEILLPTMIELIEKQDKHSEFLVLDVGCGTGALTSELAKFVRAIVGVDSSSESIKIAKRHFASENVKFVHASIANYRGGTYDLVISNMVLHTIENMDVALARVHDMLVFDGCFIFSIPHPCFWPLIKDAEFLDAGYKYTEPQAFLADFPVKVMRDKASIKVPYYHRPLSVYSNALYNAGFVIDFIVEPFPSPKQMPHYKRPWLYPGFLFFQCRVR